MSIKLTDIVRSNREGVSALAPYSGYTQWKKDNFKFLTSSSFLASVSDSNRYLKFGDKVVDAYGQNINNATEFIDFTGSVYDLNLNESLSGKMCKFSFNITRNDNRMVAYFRNTTTTIFDSGWITGTGYKEFYVIVPNTITDFNLRFYSDTTYASVTNISVREIKTKSAIDLIPEVTNRTFNNISVREIQTKSATDLIPEVTVLNQATYGLTTQTSVNAGDYVVLNRQELVTNGTFNSDISGWTGAGSTISYDTGKLKVEVIANVWGSGNQTISNLLVGKEYILTATIQNGTGQGKIDNAGQGVASEYFTGTKSFKFTCTNSTMTIRCYAEYKSTSNYVYFDNISVKQVDEVYRAKADAPSGTSLINTTYFEVKDNLPISNQIAFLHTMDSTTKVYEGITNEILFNDALATETPRAIMLKNGFSEVSAGLYSKGSKWYIFAGYWQTLNKGAYHPVFNMAGCQPTYKQSTDSVVYWYENAVTSSIAQTFTSGIDGGVPGWVNSSYSRRPDGKYYDIIYPDQFISFESTELAFKPTKELSDEIKAYEDFRGVNGSVEFSSCGLRYGDSWSGTLRYFEITDRKTTDKYISLYGTFQETDTTKIGRYKVVISTIVGTYEATISRLPTTGSMYLDKGTLIKGSYPTPVSTYRDFAEFSDEQFIIQQSPYNSKGTQLTTDLIGNPTNYPTIMKDRLAEGKGIFGINPLLVDDTGTDMTVFGAINRKFSRKCLTTTYNYTSYNPTTGAYGSSAADLLSSNIGNYDYLNLVDGGAELVFSTYTSQNTPYKATTPMQVLTVEPKVKASNSHSLYKGAIIGNCLGKIQVGNGANGYESKVLEKAEIPKHHIYKSSGASWSGINGNWYGTIIFLDTIGNETDAPNGIGYYIYQGSYTGTENVTTAHLTLTQSNNWYYLDVTPQHSTITLDNSTTPASKWFEGYCTDGVYKYPFVAQEEMVWDITKDDTDEIKQITTTISLATATEPLGTICHFTNTAWGALYGRTIIITYSGSYSFSTAEALKCTIAENGDVLFDYGTKFAELWDGNGFGDNNKFNQLINGTRTDLNGKTIKTQFAIGSPIGRL